MDRFLEFYKEGLAHILKVNHDGYRIAEVYTQILLTKILTPHSTRYVDMQSPAGEAWSVLVYNYDGDVYASDESRMLAEMRDWTFRSGTSIRIRVGASSPAIRHCNCSGLLQSGTRGLFRLRIPAVLCRRSGIPPRHPGRHVRASTHERLLCAQHGGHTHLSLSLKRMTGTPCVSCGHGSPESR